MARFKPASGPTPQQIVALRGDPKTDQLKIFRSVVVRMLQAGKTPLEIVTWAKNPNSTAFGDSPSEFYSAVYAGIVKYTTWEDRQAVLDELENEEQCGGQ